MSLAYLLGKGSSKALHTKVNIPLLMVLSILPDIDLLANYMTGYNFHRGPTHSIIMALLFFIPFFIIYRKKAIPYFLALISHAAIGDFIVGGQIMLFWPISWRLFGLHELGGPYIDIFSGVNMVFELSLFVVAVAVMVKSKDGKVFFKADKTSLVLIIPIGTVLLPSTIGFPFSTSLIFTSPLLALAHIFFLVLFSVAVLKTVVMLWKRWFGNPPSPPPKQP
ncbi:MAG: metal-dependent hydrolase [Candidatus Bathyarchaeia archaeon]|jgi:membrane-bound metal-dependent hydrolase YbcI (DUF457 family)